METAEGVVGEAKGPVAWDSEWCADSELVPAACAHVVPYQRVGVAKTTACSGSATVHCLSKHESQQQAGLA